MRDRISIAILALGGQGGGVLADWILDLALAHGWWAQGTSVPGVAQRTGTTVYYVELFRAGPRQPVLALSPVPGDVDIVIASELMEAGRAILRGFVTRDRTTLITSTHRIFAISEKSAMGDGRAPSEPVLKAARERARRFIGFDMDAAATHSGSIISSVMFGALAASNALPFPAEAFADAIRAGGKAVEANLRGLAAGQAGALAQPTEPQAPAFAPPCATSVQGRALAERIHAELPAGAHDFALEGVRRLCDYQDHGYAALYLDRLAGIAALDDGAQDWRLSRETARHLALWMSYEDSIRVADLKTRASRQARVRADVRAQPGQIMEVVEYMHPRLDEICETLPRRLGSFILDSPRLRRLLEPLFASGRHVRTSSIGWFLLLWLLAAMRPLRRGTLRYALEQERIERWLRLLRQAAGTDPAAARELAECPGLIKGYSDTHARGLASYSQIIDWYEAHGGRPGAAAALQQLREAALADDRGDELAAALARVSRLG